MHSRRLLALITGGLLSLSPVVWGVEQMKPSKPEVMNLTQVQALGIRNLKRPQANIFTGGQPSGEQLSQLKAAGVTHIINLRPDSETGGSERPLVESKGLIYHHLPVAGAAGVTFDNASKLSQLLDGLEGDTVLVHCASGNRVGGLIALQALTEGEDLESAVAKGKNWGMTRLEAKVRKLADGQ